MSAKFSSAGTPLSTLLAVTRTAQTTTYTVDVEAGDVAKTVLDVDLTSLTGVSATFTLTLARKDANGVFHTIYNPAALTAAGKLTSTNDVLTDTLRVTVTLGGTTPSATFTVSLIGR